MSIVFMNMVGNIENQVNAIIKFVTYKFNPALVHVEREDALGLHKIIFYFDDIDDSYIKYFQAYDIKSHKSEMMRREIRKYVQNYLGIKTLGTQPPDYFAPSEFHPINIIVTYTRSIY